VLFHLHFVVLYIGLEVEMEFELREGQPTEEYPSWSLEESIGQEEVQQEPMVGESLGVPVTTNTLVIRKPKKYLDVTHLLSMTQRDAALIIGIPTSTLGKRWKEATSRKWQVIHSCHLTEHYRPYRTVLKINKEIAILSTNIENTKHKGIGDCSVLEDLLETQLQKRAIALTPVSIRLT
jgi:hypothetical protein